MDTRIIPAPPDESAAQGLTNAPHRHHRHMSGVFHPKAYGAEAS
ncbi:hypothetical protein AB6B38_13310 [Glycocaulis abyssi]|uniref:Uncharacterized protein n=1 Tax=Glycocaulis abyssi TaxID=1433403 RepID=A0ABV9ND10_9PROT